MIKNANCLLGSKIDLFQWFHNYSHGHSHGGSYGHSQGQTKCRCHDINGPIQQYLVADNIHCFGGCFCKLLLTVLIEQLF